MKLFIWIMIIFIAKGGGGGGGPYVPPCNSGNGYTYVPSGDTVICVQCYIGCQICNNGDMNQCTQCYTSYYLLNGVCLPRTPLVITDNSFTIDFDNSMKLGMDITQKFIIGSNGGNAYPNIDPNDPIPSISRGYYFFTYSYMHSQIINLSPWFTVIFWVKPSSQGMFFSKKSSSDYIQYLYVSAEGQLTYQVKVNNGQIMNLGPTSFSLIDSWHYISITCSLDTLTTKAQIFVDGSFVKESSIYNALYDDPADMYLGNEPSAGTFTGFIWRIIIYGNANHALDDFLTSGCNSGCSVCTKKLNCPDSCGFKQFSNQGKCTDCSSDCNYGCRSIDSCNLCEAKECVTCDSFYGCTSCVEGASIVNSVCTCDIGKAFNGTKCDYCDVLCSNCTSSKYFSCNTCRSAYYLAGQTCLYKIPFGWDSSKNSPYLVIDESFEAETFKGSYGIFITGSNINTFAPFNSPEISDPIPMVKRGLYFDNGAYLQSNQEIYLPYQFTINLWIKSKSGDFLEKLDKIIITYNLHAAITLENYLATKFSLVSKDATSFSDWSFYSLIVSFSNSATTIETLTNENSLFKQTKYQSLFRDLPSNYLVLGKSSNSNFTGFIYNFQLIIGAVTDFSSYITTACGDTSNSCLSGCDSNYYFDSSTNSCKQCDSSCTMGCVRSASCNLCSDQLCNVCSGFGEDLCTICTENAEGAVCSCNMDSILIKSSWKCEKCDNSYCGECTSREAVFFDCKTCIKGILFKDVCLDEIPYGYDEGNCVNLPCLLLKVNFEADFSGSYGIFDTSNSSSTFYYWNNPDLYDPIPIKGRGLYFDSGKYLISNRKLYFPHTLSILLWINSYGVGDILEKDGKIIFSKDFSITIHLSNSYQSDVTRSTISSSQLNSWNFFILSISYSSGKTSGTTYLNNNQIGTITPVNYIFKDASSYLTLGKSKNSYFKGFIYSFELYLGRSTSSNFGVLEICASSNTINCLFPCNIFEYFDGSCIACNSSCARSCVKAVSCNICKDPLCVKCPGYGDGSCIECAENAQGSNCSCNSDSVLVKGEADWSCQKCDPDYCEECAVREETYFSCSKCSKGVLFQEACLDEKPYKADSCADFPCLVINAEFETDFKGTYDVFRACSDSNTFYFWNHPESCDPIPAKDRGLYFNESRSLVSDSLYFSHSFSIVSWINSYGGGVIFQKNQRITIGSDFSASITLFNRTHGVKVEEINKSVMSDWCQFELVLSFLNGVQTIVIYLNSNQAIKLSDSGYLYRDVSSYLAIGKGETSSYFKGFIYDFKLLIGTINDPSLYNDKSICTVGGEKPCLSPCTFSEFYDDGCIACNNTCSSGCVRTKSCNLCSDRLCIKCPSFSDGICNECVVNAQGSTCTCNPDSILIKYEIDWACEKCDSGYCKVCDKREATYFDCKECESGYLINGACLDEIPYGFEENHCSDLPCLVINAEFETEFSGAYDVFKTCDSSSSFNYWHIPEECDPVPIKGRGLHFNSSQFLVSDTPLYFSHTFSIALWINSYGAGNVIEKTNQMSLPSNFSAKISLINPFQSVLLSESSTISSTDWMLFTLIVSYLNGLTTISAYMNEVQYSLNTYSQYLFRDKSSKLFIGKGTNSGFTGFIFSFKLFIGQNAVIGTNLENFCVSGDDKNCIASCKLSEYFDGSCKSCSSSCTLNCVRAPSCNICADQLCIKCSGFSDSSYCEQCTERAHGTEKCECDVNSIFVETIYNHTCEYCDALYCDICETGKWFDCSQCKVGVLAGSACLDEYPYGYMNGEEDTYIVIDAEFSKEFAEYDIFKTGNIRDQYYFFKDQELNFDPIPAIKRGLYIDNNRFIKTEEMIYLSHSFSLEAWVHAKIVGQIIRKEGTLTFSSSRTLNITLKDPLGANISVITPEAFYSTWMHISFSVSYSSGATTISSYLNNMLFNSISQDKSIFRDISSELIIGGSGFAGFIYNFKLYIGIVHDFISYSEISVCQTDKDNNCLLSCELFEYLEGSICKQCNSACETTCVRFPSCKLCNDQLCRECSGFSDTSKCYKCIERAHNLNSQNCACDANTILVTDGSDYFCEYCDLDYCSTCAGQGYLTCLECVKGKLVDNACLGQYPTGFEQCVGKELCIMAEINSKDNFNENYGVFISGANKASYNPFNSPENEDPVLVKDRGFFFDGNFSFIQSEQPYYFSHTFTLWMWIWNQGNGDILEQGDRLLLASNGSLSITLQDRLSQNFTFQTSGISLEGWTYLSYIVSYSNSATSLWIYINDREIAQQEFSTLLFRDMMNSTLLIGKSSKSYFKGFLYKLQILNNGRNKFEDLASLETCGTPGLGGCLSRCKINEFYSATYDKCKSCPISCNKGCIRNDTCNICEDPLCAVCPNFGKTNCIQCIPHASGIEKCNCDENYCLSLDRLNCIRAPYEKSPELYWFHSIPQEKIIVGNWSGEFIINTIHSFIESVELLNNTDFLLSSNECLFSSFNENFTCSFRLSIDPGYNISKNPSAVQVQYQGYLYPISFNAFHDDFSKYLMSHQELIKIKYYFEISYLKIKLYNQLVFTEEFCQDDACSSALCNKILSKDSMISLGKSINCFRLSKNELEIYLGHIQDSAKSLTFIEKVFADSSTNDTNLAYITMSIKEEKPPKPKAVFTQIGSVCCSCVLILDASRSAGMGKLSYKWSLSKFLYYSGIMTERITNITLASCQNAKEHSYFEVTLTVTDNFGQSDSSSAPVDMIYDDIPVSIANKETLNVGTDSPLKLKVTVQKSTRIELDPNPSITWSVAKSNRQLSEDEDYSTSGIEFTYLFSKLGEYVVTANVLFNRGNFTRSASVKIVATPPPPNLMVLGVDTTVYSNSYITVNLTATYGSDEIYPLEKGSVKFTETSCIYGKFVEIAGDSFNLEVSNKNSYFICKFDISLTDYPSVTKNHWVLVSPGIAPKVYIITKYPFLDWSSPVRILAHIENEMSTIISWGEANNLTFTPTTPTNQAGITIKEFSLVPGTEYEFIVTVIDKETYAKTKVSLKRYVNCPPNGGTFEIDHNSEGITLETEFGILFSGWSDPEGNEPLSYQVFIKLQDSIRALIPKTTENKFTVKLGVIGEAILLGRVYDSYGTFIEVESIVYLNNTGSTPIKSFTENLIANGTETMDSSMLISSITATGFYIAQTINNEEEINDSISNSVDALAKWMNNSMKGISLSDSSTVIDGVNILLESSGSLNETTLVKLHSTQDYALNKTKVLDAHAYMAALPNIDLIMQNLGSLAEKNSSDLSEIKIHNLISKTYNEASLKSLIPINPNEEAMNYTGVKFNSTCLSLNGQSISNHISYNSSKPNTDAQFTIDTSKNPDSTIYLISVLTLDPFKSISDGLQKEATSSYRYTEPFSFSEGNININSPDTQVDSNFVYSDKYESSLVQVGISQNINSIFSPVMTDPPLINVSVVVAYDVYDNDLQMTCSIYLQQISQFSFKFCETFFNATGVATCTCEIVGLIMIPPFPSVLRNLQDRLNSERLEIPNVGAIPVFIIFGSLLFVLYFTWLDISKLERKYADPLKMLTLNINETIAKEISTLSSNLYVNNQLINIDKLMQIWEIGQIYEVESEWNDNEERKDSETTNLERYEVYPYFKKQLRNKLESIIEDQNILDSLLTFERIKMHTENSIDKRNLEDIEAVIDALFSKKNEESENFLIWTRFLYKEKNGMLAFISKIKHKQIRNLLRFSYMPIVNLLNSLEIIKQKIKYKHYNYIIQAINKSILYPYEDDNVSKKDLADAKLKCESEETLIKSIKKLEGNIFAYIKLRTPTIKLERFIKKWIFISLKDSASHSEGKAGFIRDDISRRDTNIPVGIPIVDLDDIKVEGIDNELEGMVEKANDDYNSIYFSILPKFFAKIMEHKTDNFTRSTTFIEFFIENNDIFGIIGNTDLNFSRKGRLIYLFAAISTEIAIAISAFDGYTKYISNQVDLIFQFPEVTLVIWFVSFILGFLPLFLKVFLKDRFLETQLVKNKNDSTKNWKVIIGYLLSFSWIGGCWLYSFEKLNNYPIANIGAYLLYILQTLISFLMINGLFLPAFLASVEMYCCFKIANLKVKKWIIFFKRRLSKNKELQILPTNDYEFSNRE